ncbi:hypothetical protein ACSN2V_004629 [Vibrio parahaemolyticus]
MGQGQVIPAHDIGYESEPRPTASSAKACIELGCHFVGVEMDDDIFSATAKSLAEYKTEEEQKDI